MPECYFLRIARAWQCFIWFIVFSSRFGQDVHLANWNRIDFQPPNNRLVSVEHKFGRKTNRYHRLGCFWQFENVTHVINSAVFADRSAVFADRSAVFAESAIFPNAVLYGLFSL